MHSILAVTSDGCFRHRDTLPSWCHFTQPLLHLDNFLSLLYMSCLLQIYIHSSYIIPCKAINKGLHIVAIKFSMHFHLNHSRPPESPPFHLSSIYVSYCIWWWVMSTSRSDVCNNQLAKHCNRYIILLCWCMHTLPSHCTRIYTLSCNDILPNAMYKFSEYVAVT